MKVKFLLKLEPIYRVSAHHLLCQCTECKFYRKVVEVPEGFMKRFDEVMEELDKIKFEIQAYYSEKHPADRHFSRGSWKSKKDKEVYPDENNKFQTTNNKAHEEDAGTI